MNAARLSLFLILVVSSGCLAEPYPGIVVGNPDEEGPSVPGVPGERPDFDFPDGGSYQPSPPSADPSASGDPSDPGSIDKDPEEDEADTADQEVPGGDRVGETEPVPTPPSPSKPEHAEPYEENSGTVMMIQPN